MTGPVGHICNLIGIRPANRGNQLVKDGAHGQHNLKVGLFRMPADVVTTPHPARFKHAGYGSAMVLYMQPVANIGPLAVDRQRLAVKGIADHQGNEFFRELARPVIIGTIGEQHREAVGFVKGARHMVAGGLGRRIWAVGAVGGRFCKRRIARLQRAIDLIGGHVQKTKG